MLILALVITVMVVRSISRHKLTVRFSLLWFAVAVSMVLAAAFPGIVVWLCRLTRIQQPSNLLYLLGILLLLFITFRQSETISRQSEEIDRLTQYVSLERFLNARDGAENADSGRERAAETRETAAVR